MSLQIFHNPRCSKSRQILALIEEAGVTPEIVLYLEQPPTEAELESVIAKLGIAPADLLRKKEAEYKEAGLTNDSSDDDVLAAMIKYPKLIERPIVIKGDKAVLGRPPENVNALL